MTKQSVKPFEVVVVDNASSDETKDVALSHGNKLPIKYVYEKQVGIPYARNRAIKEAKGDILAFIDDDCEAFSDWVEIIIKANKEYPDAIAIQGFSISWPRNKPISIISQFRFDQSYLSNKNRINSSEYLLCLGTRNVCFKIKVVRKLKLFFDTSFERGEDLDFAKQILSHSQKIVFYKDINIYHWERTTLKEFMIQNFSYGRVSRKARYKWTKDYFPKRSYAWLLRYWIDFIKFCLDTQPLYRLQNLIIVFFLQNFSFGCGLYLQRFQVSQKRKDQCVL